MCMYTGENVYNTGAYKYTCIAKLSRQIPLLSREERLAPVNWVSGTLASYGWVHSTNQIAAFKNTFSSCE